MGNNNTSQKDDPTSLITDPSIEKYQTSDPTSFTTNSPIKKYPTYNETVNPFSPMTTDKTDPVGSGAGDLIELDNLDGSQCENPEECTENNGLPNPTNVLNQFDPEIPSDLEKTAYITLTDPRIFTFPSDNHYTKAIQDFCDKNNIRDSPMDCFDFRKYTSFFTLNPLRIIIKIENDHNQFLLISSRIKSGFIEYGTVLKFYERNIRLENVDYLYISCTQSGSNVDIEIIQKCFPSVQYLLINEPFDYKTIVSEPLLSETTTCDLRVFKSLRGCSLLYTKWNKVIFPETMELIGICSCFSSNKLETGENCKL
jgi:hypothetical protein